MARITWQNVAAPDMSDALRGTEQAGSLFDLAARRFSGALGDVAQRGRRDASKKAMDAGLAFGDLESWDRAVQAEGVGALGIRPDQATDELMKFVLDRRGALTDHQGDLQIQAQREQDMNIAAAREADANRDRDFAFGVDQYGFGRTQAANQRADQDLAEAEANEQLDADALRLAREVSRGASTIEEARRSITQQGLDPSFESLVLGHIDNSLPSNAFEVDPQYRGTALLREDFAVVADGLESIDRQTNIELSNNPTLALYDQASQSAEGYDNPVDGLVDRLRGRVNPTNDEEENMISDSASRLQDTFNSLKREYPGVPPAILSQVMENNLMGTGIGGFFESGLQLDNRAIRNQLDLFRDPEQLTLLEQERTSMQTRQRETQAAREEFESVVNDYEVALSRGNQEDADKALKRLNRLREMLTPEETLRGGFTEEDLDRILSTPANTLAPSPFGEVLQSNPGAPNTANASDAELNEVLRLLSAAGQ